MQLVLKESGVVTLSVKGVGGQRLIHGAAATVAASHCA